MIDRLFIYFHIKVESIVTEIFPYALPGLKENLNNHDKTTYACSLLIKCSYLEKSRKTMNNKFIPY